MQYVKKGLCCRRRVSEGQWPTLRQHRRALLRHQAGGCSPGEVSALGEVGEWRSSGAQASPPCQLHRERPFVTDDDGLRASGRPGSSGRFCHIVVGGTEARTAKAANDAVFRARRPGSKPKQSRSSGGVASSLMSSSGARPITPPRRSSWTSQKSYECYEILNSGGSEREIGWDHVARRT